MVIIVRFKRFKTVPKLSTIFQKNNRGYKYPVPRLFTKLSCYLHDLKFIPTNMKKLICLFSFISVWFCADAEEKQGSAFHFSGDLVSSYIWRGLYMSPAAIQPSIEFEAGNFTAEAWGSVSLDGEDREIDLTASYTLGDFVFSLTDMWWSTSGSDTKYFNYRSRETEHTFEASVAYTLPYERFPLTLSWNTVFAGMDKKADGRQAYASYAELAYPFKIKNTECEAICGFTPYKAEMQYETSGFAFTNLALRAAREIRITSSFSLPLFTELSVNPASENVHFVIGFTLR